MDIYASQKKGRNFPRSKDANKESGAGLFSRKCPRLLSGNKMEPLPPGRPRALLEQVLLDVFESLALLAASSEKIRGIQSPENHIGNRRQNADNYKFANQLESPWLSICRAMKAL